MLKRAFFSVILALLAIFFVDYFVGISPVRTSKNSEEYSKDTLLAKPILKYGIPVDSFYIEKGSLRYGQTIGNLLLDLNVDPEVVNSLTLVSADSFDPHKFKAGNHYEVFRTRDTLAAVRYLVYEDSPVDFVIFDISDTLAIYPFKKEVTTVRRVDESAITSSLWETMKQKNINPMLALELSDVFAWTVDFFGLYPEDKFKVIYDELYVDSLPVGLGTIHAAWFEHRGEKFYAFRYEQDSVASYWDEKGNSLRKSFLKAPLRFSRISSRFSGRRFHPVLRIYRPHSGVDYAAPAGTPVMAIGDGVVIDKGYNESAGNFIKIRHNSVYTTGYNHLSRFGKGIAEGVRVKQGDIIGYVGSTGYATGPHLDLRFWMNGKPVDPLKVKSPPVEPIRPENLEKFRQAITPIIYQLDSLTPAGGSLRASR